VEPSTSAQSTAAEDVERSRWRRFVGLFLATVVGGLGAIYLFILLIDPYNVVPFSLPIDRRIVSINQRYMYPQIVRSRHFDSYVLGPSTARLIDPQQLNAPFGARFANLSMDALLAWEQYKVMELFHREVGPPKVLFLALDQVWCRENADRERITFRGFPDWLYDDNPWNDYLHLLNGGTAEIAVRLLGYQFGLYRERIRSDGFEVFTPPESRYDLARARQYIWQGRTPGTPPPDGRAPALTAAERQKLVFPALAWLDASLAKLPVSSRRILVFMPVHVAVQPWPGSRTESIENECKERIVAIARRHDAMLIDWRLASGITREDSNYWDPVHFRLPIAQRVTHDLIAAAIDGRESEDGSYRITVRGRERAHH
jgi:hypothetical protein